MDINTFYKQLTVNYLLSPENWTRPKVNTERSQMNKKNIRIIVENNKALKGLWQNVERQNIEKQNIEKDKT